MKSTLVLFVVLFGCSAMFGQEVTVHVDAEPILTREIEPGVWFVKLGDEDYLLLRRSAVDALTRRIDSLRAVVEHNQKIIAAQDTLLSSYRIYEERADSHIVVQQALYAVADSLYRGYRDLYADLKRFTGRSTYSLTAGAGLVYLRGNTWKPVAMVGFGFGNWVGQYQIGSGYHGVVAGFRLPFGF